MSKIVVGMSGGVDSSISAYLLKKQGHEVIGVFMRNWDSVVNNDLLGNKTINNHICPQEQDYRDAKKVAGQLNIPLHRVNFIQEYWDEVFEKFLHDYKNGYTPNPDILCNKYIKFDKFLNHVLKEFNPDLIAMGHYAKTINGLLFKPLDLEKDQTYFLAQLSKEQLQRVVFPLAQIKKIDVRKIARELNLSIADKKDSTGICFIGERNFQNFLKNYIPAQPGDVINVETNKKIGTHNGIMYYTIGQRKGLNLGGMSEPFYVAGHNLEKRILYVSPSSNRNYLLSTSCDLIDLNLIDFNIHKLQDSNLKAKFRYRQKEISVSISKLTSNSVTVAYKTPVEAITPGQHCVFYLDNECLGGGVIKNVYYYEKKRVFLT